MGLVSFNLTEAQKSSGTFIESEEIPSVIEYTISVGQTSSVNADYSFSNQDVVYNQVVADADDYLVGVCDYGGDASYPQQMHDTCG